MTEVIEPPSALSPSITINAIAIFLSFALKYGMVAGVVSIFNGWRLKEGFWLSTSVGEDAILESLRAFSPQKQLSLLYEAIKRGDTNTTQILTRHFQDNATFSLEAWQRAATLAICHKQYMILNFLLDQDMENVGRLVHEFLCHAIQEGNFEVVQIISSHNEIVNRLHVIDNEYAHEDIPFFPLENSIEMASILGYHGVLKVLIDADLIRYPYSKMHKACMYCIPAVFKLLHNKYTISEDQFKSLLKQASFNDCIDIVQQLLEHSENFSTEAINAVAKIGSFKMALVFITHPRFDMNQILERFSQCDPFSRQKLQHLSAGLLAEFQTGRVSLDASSDLFNLNMECLEALRLRFSKNPELVFTLHLLRFRLLQVPQHMLNYPSFVSFVCSIQDVDVETLKSLIVEYIQASHRIRETCRVIHFDVVFKIFKRLKYNKKMLSHIFASNGRQDYEDALKVLKQPVTPSKNSEVLPIFVNFQVVFVAALVLCIIPLWIVICFQATF